MARISAQPKRVSCGPGEDATLHVVVENVGNTVFNAASHPLWGFFTLGGHLRQGTTVVDNDLFHEPLPSDVECGGNCSLECTFRTPEIRGDYILELDLVIEGVAWLGQLGSELCLIRMSVS